VWDAEQKRLGITASFQWKPTDSLLFTVDGLHGEYTTHRDEYHLATRPFGFRPLSSLCAFGHMAYALFRPPVSGNQRVGDVVAAFAKYRAYLRANRSRRLAK
jgi:hypothetical protein